MMTVRRNFNRLYELIKSGRIRVTKNGYSPLLHRFIDGMSKSGMLHPVCGQCWEWTRTRKGKYGHGQITEGGREIATHRLSWELHCGEIPDGMCVCHRCDNPPCVHPDHLFLGTKADNAKDMYQKARGQRMLTPEVIEFIRENHVKGTGRGRHCTSNTKELAELLGIDIQRIQNVVSGRKYSYL